jgi:tRNA threonylcarbamoyladenosine biosynthesis protein TsaE
VLTSDLGGGKTTFVKGLAKGLGSLDIATSPTFTINRTYACRDNLVLEHFDFYRLNDPGIVAHELSEVIDQKDTIIAIEWGDIVGDVLPTQRIEIAINRRKDDENKRELIATYPAEYGYVFEESK